MLRRALSSSSSTKVRLTFVSGDGLQRTAVTGHVHDTVLDVCKDNGIPVEGACGGGMCCSTCHVILAPEHFSLPTQEQEIDMLDQAVGLTKTSRLGCQIDLTKEMDGMVVWLPREVQNRQA